MIEKASNLHKRILDHLNDVDTRVGALHQSWDGNAAAAHREAHESWMRGAKDVHAALQSVRDHTARAHGVYGGVADHNAEMWP